MGLQRLPSFDKSAAYAKDAAEAVALFQQQGLNPVVQRKIANLRQFYGKLPNELSDQEFLEEHFGDVRSRRDDYPDITFADALFASEETKL